MGRPRSQNGGASSSSFDVPAAAAEELSRAKRSLKIDQIKRYLENDCLRNYMSKNEAEAFLLIEQGVQPAVTEIVWEELERQNPEFFRHYKLRLMLKDQMVKFNELLASQRDAMKENLQNRVASGDPTCSTSADVSNNSTESSMLPSTSGMYRPLAENQTVNAVNNGTVPDPMMDNNGAFIQNGNVCSAPMIDNSLREHHHNSMNGAFIQNGNVCSAPIIDNSTRENHHNSMNGAFTQNGNVCSAPMIDNSTREHHHNSMNGAFTQNGNVCSAPMIDNSTREHHHNSMNGAFIQNGNVCSAPMMDNFTRMHHGMNRALFPSGMQHLIDQVAPNNGGVWVQGMDPSIRILNEINRARIYSQATSPAVYNPSAFQQAMSNNPFDAGAPHYAPPLINNRPIFSFSEESWLDLMERNRPPSEANQFHFPLAHTVNLERIFEDDFAGGMINDLPNYSLDAEFPGRMANGLPNELNGTQGEDPRGF